ncbi:MAG: rhamnulokinase [Anaerolineaceae bacterium]|nr:rhamnulokinase [Anaerolineaceae bacterium]
MVATANFLAVDLGAESGRAMLGRFDGERLSLAEVHRFPNQPVRLPDGLHWDVLNIWASIKQGIAAAAADQPLSVGVDTWGVDFGLLDDQGALIGNPYHYRDSRTDGLVEVAFDQVGQAAIFEQTGIQFMPINSLYQLLALVRSQSPALHSARTFLTMPDLFNYWLTGRKVSEFTIATTTQCYDPRRGGWATHLMEQLGIPTEIFPEIVPPGTVLGDLQPALAAEIGIPAFPVITPACHDTGSAVAAVPAKTENFAWISSGTWSIMGALTPAPVINAASLAANMTNEGGTDGRFRFSRNVMGLWLVQECLRTWAGAGDVYTYDDLTRMAAAALPFSAVLNPDAPQFLPPGDMPSRIHQFCQATHQPTPADKGALVRCILESLALKYRWVLAQLETILGYRLDPVHIVGGGTQNRLLCQFTADATGRVVIAGPVEATAYGSLIIQMVARGDLASLAEGRELVRRSTDVQTYAPIADRDAWDVAYARLLALGV